MMKASINGEVFRQNYSVGTAVRVPHEVEKFIADAVWEAGATEETVHGMVDTALTAARAVFADPEKQWNQVQCRVDAKVAVMHSVYSPSSDRVSECRSSFTGAEIHT